MVLRTAKRKLELERAVASKKSALPPVQKEKEKRREHKESRENEAEGGHV